MQPNSPAAHQTPQNNDDYYYARGSYDVPMSAAGRLERQSTRTPASAPTHAESPYEVPEVEAPYEEMPLPTYNECFVDPAARNAEQKDDYKPYYPTYEWDC